MSKELIAASFAEMLPLSGVIGVGSGTTVELILKNLRARVAKEKTSCSVVATSLQSALQCTELGFQVLHPSYAGPIDLAFDGADEIDPALNAIKGRGGALLQEKLVARAASKLLLVVDESKLVSKLGQNFPMPIEVLPEIALRVQKELTILGATAITLRDGLPGKLGPTITEKGNVILDCVFSTIDEKLITTIKGIPGVIEHGVFWQMADEVWCVKGGKVVVEKR